MYSVWSGKVKEVPLEDPIKMEAVVLPEDLSIDLGKIRDLARGKL